MDQSRNRAIARDNHVSARVPARDWTQRALALASRLWALARAKRARGRLHRDHTESPLVDSQFQRSLNQLRTTKRALWLRAMPRHFLTHAAADARELGLAGEVLVARRLPRRGARVLAKRLRTRDAEIDLLAERDDELWLVEVKTGRLARVRQPNGPPVWDPRGLPGKRLTNHQRSRLEAAAKRLLRESTHHRRAKIVLIEVLVDPRTRAVDCRVHAEPALGFIH